MIYESHMHYDMEKIYIDIPKLSDGQICPWNWLEIIFRGAVHSNF